MIKRKTKELLSVYPDQFTSDFSENKVKVSEFAKVGSKKLRNTIAGYMSRLKKKE